MKRYKVGIYLGIGLSSIVQMAFSGDRIGEKIGKSNVVFFLVDDLGWTDLGCFGSRFYETPNIDRLAKEGVRFTNAYAACHVCSPTRASILTGKYPATLHLTDWLPGRKEFPFQRLKNAVINQNLPFEEITLAEALKEQGYRTAIFGKWHLGEDLSRPEAHGFDIHVPHAWQKGWPNGGYYYPFKLDGIADKEGDYLTDRLTDEALKFVEENRDTSFFLYFSHFAVHDPIQGRPDLVKKYKEKLNKMSLQEGPSYILEGNPDSPDYVGKEEALKMLKQDIFQGYSQLTKQMVKIKQRQDNAQFAGMVESMDESLGRVIAKLEELELVDNTIIVFVSDNGGMSAANFGNPDKLITKEMLDSQYATSNLPLRGGKGWLYEGGIRVPMIIKWPGHCKKGTICEVPVTSVDFYPTIMEMLGLKIPDEKRTDGVSITSLVEGANKLDRDAIYWHFPHYSNHGMQSPGGAIRCGDYKLLEYFENNTVQLFNLKKDLGEQNDISTSNPKKVHELRTKLHQWRERINAQMMEPNPNYSVDK
jgi:arylsulfatase A